MRLLSLLVGALAFFAPSVIAQRQGYEIGTASGLADVMSNGIARAGWDGEVSGTYFDPRITSLKLVSRLNITGMRPQPTIQTQGYSIRFVYSVPNVVLTTMDPEQQAGTLTVGLEQALQFNFDCLSTRGITATMVTVITSFHTPPGDDSQFDFYKRCELPPISIGSYGPDGPHATVVANGKPVDGFQFTATPDETSTAFDMWLPNPTSQYYPYFNFTTPPLLIWNHFSMPYLTYEISEPYILPENVVPYSKLTITYNCDPTKPATSTAISVIIDNGFAPKLEFEFMKNCSGTTTGLTLPNVFHVGSSDTSNDVIQGGIPIGKWGTDSGFPMSINQHEIDLFAYINTTTRIGEQSLPFYVVATVSNDNKVFILNDGSSAPTLFLAKNMSFIRTKIPMEITCIHTGTASGTVVFSFGDVYADVTVRFQYTCSLPLFDVNFLNSDASSIIAPVIIKNNLQTWSYISPQTSHKEVFAVILNKDSPWREQDITLNVSHTNIHMKPIVLPNTPWLHLTFDHPIYMQIYFHCNDMPISTTPVTITIDYGWNVKTNITFQKTCPETDVPASSSGWSAAGIFFFTVFILTLVGCLTGAGYKYTKEDKRGWEIIPGITYYRACYEKACPTKRYTPQTDYYHDNIPDNGGKSYQTEL